MARRVVTESEIRRMKAGGEAILQLESDDLVTPLARDIARQLGITICEPGKAPPAEALPTPAEEAPALTKEKAVIEEASIEEDPLVDIYSRVNPAIVNVQVIRRTKGFRFSPLLPEEFRQPSQGSGFVYSKEGYIVTNAHLVEGGEEIEVTLFDGTAIEAEIVSADPQSDMAVLKGDLPPEKLHIIELGNSDKLKVGQQVIAIGNPLGLTGTMTKGIISALGRTLCWAPFCIRGVIQTDAALSPGSSGGPLLDSQGRVIGVNVAIATVDGAVAGIGFAIPVNLVKQIVPKLIEKG